MGLHVGSVPDVPPKWQLEQQFYEQIGALTMSKPHDIVYGDEIGAAFEASSTGKIERKDAVAKKVDADWASNVTMINLDCVEAFRSIDGTDVDLAQNPWQFAAALRDIVPLESGARLCDLAAAWFGQIAYCFGQIKGDIKIEVCLGSITTVLEQIRYQVRLTRFSGTHAHEW